MSRALFTASALAISLAASLISGPTLAQTVAPVDSQSEKASKAYDQPGPYMVQAAEGAWKDDRRARLIPFLIRYPKDAPGRLPVVIFSHDLGGSKESAAYYAEHLVSHGYVVLNVQHPGSDVTLWGGQFPDLKNPKISADLRKAVSPQSAMDRFQDIYLAVFALHSLDRQPGALKERIDLTRIGMSGHSYGATTTQAMAGQAFARGRKMGHDEFKAFLAMSPAGATDGHNADAFGDITRPFLFLTGSDDNLTVNGKVLDASERQKPYLAMKRAPSALMVLNGADHLVFSGRQELGLSKPTDERFRQLIKAASLSYWDAMLRDDAEARAWLIGPGMAALAGSDAQIQSRKMDR
jgi:predicted dienelactone hydrolase